MENFKQKFNTILTEKLNVNSEDIKREAKFSDFGLNSLDMIELIIDFEKYFNIEIPDNDIEKIITIGDAEDYLKPGLINKTK